MKAPVTREKVIELVQQLPEEQLDEAFEILLKLRNSKLSLNECILANMDRVIEEDRSLLLRLANYDSGHT